MTVLVRPVSVIGASGAFVTQYAMDFVGNGNAPLDTNLYVIARGQGNPATTDFMQANVTTLSALTCSRIGGVGNVVSSTCIFPALLLNTHVRGLKQFAEARFISESINGLVVGPAVFCSGDWAIDQPPAGGGLGGNGYVIGPQAGTGLPNFEIRRASITATVIRTLAGGWAANDLVRLVVTPGGAGNTLDTFRNGVLLDSFVDNGAARPTTKAGWPAFMMQGIQVPNGSNIVWSQISWGLA